MCILEDVDTGVSILSQQSWGPLLPLLGVKQTILFTFVHTKVILHGGTKWMRETLFKKPAFIMAACFPGLSRSMSSANGWFSTFAPVPWCPWSAWRGGFRTPSYVASVVQHVLVFLLFNVPVLFFPPLPSSSMCMASFLYADNSQIYTYSPSESPALDSAASWASPLGWFIVQPRRCS